MGQVIGYVVKLVGAIKGWMATSAVWQAIQYAAAAYSVASSINQQRKMRRMMSSLRDQGRTLTLQEPVGSRQVAYGTVRIGGNRVFAHCTGTKNEYLHVIIAHVGHEVNAINDVYFGNEIIPLDGSGNATGDFSGFVRVKKYLGTDTQTAGSGTLDAEAPSIWTANHRLRGIACTEWRFKYDTDKFPGGVENVSVEIDGKKLYDPRTGLTVFSNNPALVVRDYLTNTVYGMGATSAEVDDDLIIAAANVCDESISLSGGGTEVRYACDGIVDTSVPPGENLDALLKSMAGWAVYSGGKWRVFAGAFRASSATFSLGDLRGPITFQTKASMRDACNGVKGIFISETNQSQPADFPPIYKQVTAPNITTGARCTILDLGTTDFTLIGAASNAVGVTFTATGAGTGTGVVDPYLGEDGGERSWRDIELPFTSSASMCQRLAKIELELARQEINVSLSLKLGGLKIRAGDVITLPFARYGWDSGGGKLFEVLDWRLAVEEIDNVPSLGVDVVCREISSTSYDWTTAEETTVDAAPNTTLPDPWTVGTPTGLTAVSGASTVQIQADGTAVPRVLLAWNTPNNIHVESGGKICIEYKPNAGGTWFPWTEIRGDALSVYVTDVRIGVSFDFRIRFENNAGVRGSYATVTGHTVAGDTTAPSALSAPTVTAYPGYNRVEWAKSADADTTEYAVYRNTSATSVGATKLGETDGLVWDDPGATPGTTYHYAVRPIDGSENVGNYSGWTSVATSLAPVGAAVPNAPTAATLVAAGSDDTYLAGDGTVFAFITMAVPALPTNAVWQNLLYRRNGATEWLVAAQLKNTGSVNVRIDDLTPGVSYDVATQAWSGAGGSAVTTATSSPFTAPNRTTIPATPTGGALSRDGVKPLRFHSTGIFMYGTCVSWTRSTDSSVAYYEVKATLTNSDSATDYSWSPPGLSFAKTTEPTCIIYSQTLPIGHVRLRAVNRSGVTSNWAYLGNATSAATTGVGTIAEQDDTDVSVAGIKTGDTAASSVRQVLARFMDTTVPTLSGGSPTESFNVSLSNRGFGTKPDLGVIQCANDANIVAAYDYDSGSNSSTNAVVRVATIDGSNITGGAYRFSCEFIEFN